MNASTDKLDHDIDDMVKEYLATMTLDAEKQNKCLRCMFMEIAMMAIANLAMNTRANEHHVVTEDVTNVMDYVFKQVCLRFETGSIGQADPEAIIKKH